MRSADVSPETVLQQADLLNAAARSSAMELVAIWVDPELEELSEVTCCLLYFVLQFFLCQDSVSGIDQGMRNVLVHSCNLEEVLPKRDNYTLRSLIATFSGSARSAI